MNVKTYERYVNGSIYRVREIPVEHCLSDSPRFLPVFEIEHLTRWARLRHAIGAFFTKLYW